MISIAIEVGHFRHFFFAQMFRHLGIECDRMMAADAAQSDLFV
jgi:hypothetical protein